MLVYPLELPMSDQVKRKLLDYYGARINRHGPNMTWGFYAIGYSELDDRRRAYENFKASITPFIRPPFNLYSESPRNENPDILSGKATTLSSVIHGFAGLRVRDDGIHFKPRLPNGWTTITFRRLPIGKAVYNIAVDDRGAVKTTLLSGTPDIPIFDAEGREISSRHHR